MTKWSKVSQKNEKKEGRQKKEVDKKSASNWQIIPPAKNNQVKGDYTCEPISLKTY